MTSSLTESLTHREDLQMRSAYPSTRLTVADLEEVQVILCEAQLDYQLELVDGKIIIMGPSDTRLGSSSCRIVADRL